jgi:hypothetical protein
MASADGGALELMARSNQAPAQSKAGTALPRLYTPVATSATLPRSARGASSGKQRGQLFPEIRPEITAAWEAAERKYKLPRGILQTAMGLANNGGYDAKPTPRPDTGAMGWFGTTAELRRELNISDQETSDPIRMGEHAARNMRRSIDAYHKFAGETGTAQGAAPGVKLPSLGNTVDDVPKILMLTQLGPVAGPRALANLHLNAQAPLTRILPEVKNPDGSVRDNSRTLIMSGVPSNITVGDFYNKLVKGKVDPYLAETVRGQEMPRQPAQQPAPTGQEVAPPTSDAGRFPSGRSGAGAGATTSDVAPRPPGRVPDVGDVRVDERGAHGYTRGGINVQPWLIDTVRQASRTLPAGYRVEVTSTVDRRTRGTPWHPSGRAIDVRIVDDQGRKIPNLGNPNVPGWKVYENFAAAAKAYQLQAHPDKKFTWGGHFNSGVPYDRMHMQSGGPSARNFTPQQLAAGAAALKGVQQPTETATATTAPTQQSPTAPTVEAAAAPVRKPSMYGATSTFGAPVSPPVMTAQGMTSEPQVNRLAIDVPLPQSRPTQTQIAAIPDDMSAAASEPTPQTAQPTTQATQAPPVAQPTAPTTPENSGYTVDDMNEHAPEYVSPAAGFKSIADAIYNRAAKSVSGFSTALSGPSAPTPPPPVVDPNMPAAGSNDQLGAMIAATGEGMLPVGQSMPFVWPKWGKGDAAANAGIPVDTGPKRVKTMPMTGGGEYYTPPVPQLTPDLITKQPKPGTPAAASTIPGGVVFNSGTAVPPPPGGAGVFRVDPRTGRILAPNEMLEQQPLEDVEQPVVEEVQ